MAIHSQSTLTLQSAHKPTDRPQVGRKEGWIDNRFFPLGGGGNKGLVDGRPWWNDVKANIKIQPLPVCNGRTLSRPFVPFLYVGGSRARLLPRWIHRRNFIIDLKEIWPYIFSIIHKVLYNINVKYPTFCFFMKSPSPIYSVLAPSSPHLSGIFSWIRHWCT